MSKSRKSHRGMKKVTESFRTRDGRLVTMKKWKKPPAKSEAEIASRMRGMHPKMIAQAQKKWRESRGLKGGSRSRRSRKRSRR